jgi:oligoendopeptidase F
MKEETVYPIGRWDLSDVLDDRNASPYSQIRLTLESDVSEFENLRPKLNDSTTTETLLNAFRLLERITEACEKITLYAYMRFSEDTRSETASSDFAASQELVASVDNRTMFFKLWLSSLSEERTERLSTFLNPDQRYYVQKIRKRAPYTLQEPVEQAINLKNTTGYSAWVRHYERLTSEFTYRVRVRGRFIRDDSGKPKTFVTSELVRLAYSSDPAVRKSSYVTLFAKYAEHGRHLGEIYKNIVKDWYNENIVLRHYNSPIAARNIENDVSDQAVSSLLDSCRENIHVFQRFFRMKAGMLGVKRLRRYDIYAPVGREEQNVNYPDAIKIVLEAYKTFDDRIASLVKNVFDNQHVHSEVKPGKISGAYCAPVTPGIVPYILFSYSGSIKDLYTIAHESGHAVHDQLASRHSVLTYSPPLVLAETASVFGEMILYDFMVENRTGGGNMKMILEEKLSEMYSTIQRQAYFVIFELAAHESIRDGKTVDELCDSYLNLLREQFGDSLEVPDEFRWEWTYIPHIYHTPFYCYAYSFGNLLSLALYNQYKERGREFVTSYIKLLSYGGSESPQKVLKEVGVDPESREFWRNGFKVLKGLVSDLEHLI